MTMIANAPARTRRAPKIRKPLVLVVLDWLAERDRRYREAAKLRGMPAERLEDMGMTAGQADAEYYRNRATCRVDAIRISAPSAW